MHVLHALTVLLLSLTLALAAPTPIKMQVADMLPGAVLQPNFDHQTTASTHYPAHQELQVQALEKRRSLAMALKIAKELHNHYQARALEKRKFLAMAFKMAKAIHKVNNQNQNQ